MNAREFVAQCIKKPITRYQLIKAGYKIIGEGSARIVVRYSCTIVIKFAKNIKGYVQNRVELEAFKEMKMHFNTKRIATILDFVKDDEEKVTALIVRNYPRKVCPSELKEKVINNLKNQLRCFNGLSPETKDTDLDMSSSWRKTLFGKMVCVDYGFDKDTKYLYYYNGEKSIRQTTYLEVEKNE